MDPSTARHEVIHAYRLLIDERYSYDKVTESYDLPKTFNQEKLLHLKSYFLDHIYPTPDKREEIDHAFETLQGYTNQPKQLMSLLRDSSALLLTMGWQLPKILRAGLSALQSFKAASRLEAQLVQGVIDNNIEIPLSKTAIESLLSSLPRQIIFDFIEDTLQLFETLENRKLVKRIIKVVDVLVAKMKNKPDIYGSDEINAVLLGKEIIIAGDRLYNGLERQEQKEVFRLIADIERDYINSLYPSTSDSTDA